MPGQGLKLLRQSAQFRRLWLAQVVSELGDWFNIVALYTLLLRLTGSGRAMAWLLILKVLPYVLLGDLAGQIADRLPRKGVMIATDLLRAGVVLLFLLVRRPEHVWAIYALSVAQMALSAIFEPARQAVVPQVVPEASVVAANALGGATWSVVMALGGLCGGLFAAWTNVGAAFVVDALSYLGSAALLVGLRPAPIPAGDRPARADAGARAALRLARHLPGVMASLGIKAVWGLAAGYIVVMPVLAQREFSRAFPAEVALGVLQFTRGLGAFTGSFLAALPRDPQATRRWLGLAFAAMAVGFLLAARAPGLWLAALSLSIATTGSGYLWVASLNLLQVQVPNRSQGSIFALDNALCTSAMILSSYGTGWLLDVAGLQGRDMLVLLAAAMLVPAAAWMWAIRSGASAPDAPATQTPPPYGPLP